MKDYSRWVVCGGDSQCGHQGRQSGGQFLGFGRQVVSPLIRTRFLIDTDNDNTDIWYVWFRGWTSFSCLRVRKGGGSRKRSRRLRTSEYINPGQDPSKSVKTSERKQEPGINQPPFSLPQLSQMMGQGQAVVVISIQTPLGPDWTWTWGVGPRPRSTLGGTYICTARISVGESDQGPTRRNEGSVVFCNKVKKSVTVR